MLDLSFHGNNKEYTEVQDENRIVDTNKSQFTNRIRKLRNVEEGEPGTEEGNSSGTCCRMPELEFRQSDSKYTPTKMLRTVG